MNATQQLHDRLHDTEAFSPERTIVYGQSFINNTSLSVEWIRRVCAENDIIIELQAFSQAMLRFEVKAHCNRSTYTSRLVHDLLVDFFFYSKCRIFSLERFRFCCSLYSTTGGRLLGLPFVEISRA